jgi:hypothetical protein
MIPERLGDARRHATGEVGCRGSKEEIDAESNASALTAKAGGIIQVEVERGWFDDGAFRVV